MPEIMDVDMMETMLIRAYNGVTFKNALLCALDWCNWYHCANIHKDTDMYIDPETGKLVEAYTKVTKTWLVKNNIDPSTVNPSNPKGDLSIMSAFRERWTDTKGRDVKIKKVTDYSKYHSYSEVQYPSGSPKDHKWYEKSANSDTYWLTIDTYVVSNKTYYEDVGPNPWHEGWYELQLNNVSVKSQDMTVVAGKTYYTSKDGTKYAYFVTTDTVWDDTKKYYHYKSGSTELITLPDYTSKYVCTVDLNKILGLETEVTLTKHKRPVMEEQ